VPPADVSRDGRESDEDGKAGTPNGVAGTRDYALIEAVRHGCGRSRDL
jgi:hypothetical protein